MSYVETTGNPAEGCIFCEFPTEDNDEENLILARAESAYIILNKFPYNTGHLIVVPFSHESRYDHLDPAAHADISLLTSNALRALDETYSPDGYNVGINLGRAGGAGIPDHVHQHIVPRWTGDANFMTTLAEAKVLPESLEDTYAKLRDRLS